MVFSSAVFLFYFLPIILLVYFLIARGNLLLQNMILLLGSFVFYFWGEKQYTILVLASIFFNFLMGIAIDRSKNPLKKSLLFIAIAANLLILFYYKYFGFFISNIEWLSGGRISVSETNQNIHLPLGISFFIFQGFTYIIDVYRKDAQVSRNPLNTGLYILFFPQLIAGPIVRYKDVDDQLTNRKVTSDRIYTGVKRFIIGFAKKILIANTAGAIVDSIYGLPSHQMGVQLLWLAALCYALQIYFDFSGYSDMAIGLAKIFGFDFLENFNFPYSATSIKDFWRRWHISLSNFFRDYVYIPLGGNRKGNFRTYVNLTTVFLLTGIWHGASWNFVIWGLYHGMFLILEKLGLEKVLDGLPKLLRHFYSIGVVVVGWVIFRVEDFQLLGIILKKMFLVERGFQYVYGVGYYLNNYTAFILLLGIIFSFPVYGFFQKAFRVNTQHAGLRLTSDFAFLFIFLLSLSAMASSTFNPFIYFRF